MADKESGLSLSGLNTGGSNPYDALDPPAPVSGSNPYDALDPAQKMRPVSQRGTILDPLMQGLTLYSQDEISAGLDAAVAFLQGKSPSDAYNKRLARERANVAGYRERHPYLSAGAEIAGSIPSAIAVPGGGWLKSGASGALYGGLAGFNSGEGGPENRLKEAGKTAAIAAPLSAAAPIVGKGVSKLIASRAAAPTVDVPGRVALSHEFGVPMTTGQISGNIDKQAAEEAMRHGTKGTIATRTMQTFDKGQQTAKDAALDQMAADFARGSPRVDTPMEAGDKTVEAIRKRAAGLKRASQQEYSTAELLDPSIDAAAVKDAPNYVTQGLINNDVIVDRALHPAASKAMDEVDQLASLIDNPNSATRLGAPGTVPQGMSVSAMTLKGIETARKRIASLEGTNPADGVALKAVKRQFDNWLDDAIDNNLFSGDPAGLDALKRARGLWRDYRAMTDPATGDAAGAKIAKMIKQDVTGVEAANWIMGTSALGGSGEAYRVASRLKSLLGSNSEQWNAIRQATWSSLTKAAEGRDQPGAQKVASSIYEFVNGRGKPIAALMFAPQELSKMQRYADLSKALVPDPKSTNPPKSGYAAIRGLMAMGSALGASIGAGIGSQVGVNPAVSAGVGAMAVPIFREAVGAVKSGRAINPNLDRLIRQAITQPGAKAGRRVNKTLQTINRSVTPVVEQRRRGPLEVTVPVPPGRSP